MTERPDLSASRVDASVLRGIAGPLGLAVRGYGRALELAGCSPDLARWRTMLSGFLLAVGAAFILTGIAAFFAYNWTGLPHLAKFALIEGSILISVVAAAWQGLDSGWGRSALFSASVLCGILLAVFGQTYQTGADPYGLFLGWMLLILPWVLIGRQAGLWLLALVLANLTLILLWQQVLFPPEDFGGELVRALGPGFVLVHALTDFGLAQLVFALNVSAMLAWEYLAARGVAWARSAWLVRVVASFALASMTGTTLVLIFARAGFEVRDYWGLGPPLLLVLFGALCLWFYQTKRRDLFILAACLLALIIVVTAFVARAGSWAPGFMLFLALLLVGQTAAAAMWLRRVAERWRRSP